MNTPPGYIMRREGTKRYAFFQTWNPYDEVWSSEVHSAAAVFRCRCSHIEARKRFAAFLVLRRLTS